jgi:hypothetical protein
VGEVYARGREELGEERGGCEEKDQYPTMSREVLVGETPNVSA